jgi:hypothetical protein
MFNSIPPTSLTGIIIISTVIIVGFLFIFLLSREIMCWYWKINKILELQTEIRNYLKTIAGITPTIKSAPDNIIKNIK